MYNTWTDKHIVRHTNRKTNLNKDGQTYEWTDKLRDSKTDGHMKGRTSKHTDGPICRQTDRPDGW
jgi:hypothetical protein